MGERGCPDLKSQTYSAKVRLPKPYSYKPQSLPSWSLGCGTRTLRFEGEARERDIAVAIKPEHTKLSLPILAISALMS